MLLATTKNEIPIIAISWTEFHIKQLTKDENCAAFNKNMLTLRQI